MTIRILAAALLVSSAAWVWLPPWACLLLITGAGIVWRWGAENFSQMARLVFFALLWCGFYHTSLGLPFHAYPLDGDTSVSAEFVVSGDPVMRPSFDGSPSFRIPIKLGLLTPDFPLSWHDHLFKKRVVLITDDQDQINSFIVGTRWQALGRLESRDGPHTGLFRSIGRFHPDNGTLESLPVKRGDWLLFGLFRMRHALASYFEGEAGQITHRQAILKALLFGDRSDLGQEVMAPFARTGLVHVFAISGLHIAMLAGMLWFCLRVFGISYRHRAVFILPVLFVFILYSGFGASSLRAFIMLGCLWTAPLWYRRTDVMQALALAVCVILVVSPGQVADVGFQYSFLLVTGLLIFTPQVSAKLIKFVRPDPWAPVNPVRRSVTLRIVSPVLQALSVSFISIVIATPLTAYHFNLFSPVGVLGNLLAVPLVFLILLTGFPVLILTTLPFSELTVLWAIPETLAQWLLNWTSMLESLSGGWFWVSAPSLWMVCSGLTLLFLGGVRPGVRRPCLCASLGILVCFCTQQLIGMGTTELVRLPTDRGQAFLLRRGFHPAILVDTGSEWDSWLVQNVLKERGVNRLGAVFFTHDDPRHIEGWASLASGWKAEHLYGSANRIERIRRISASEGVSGLSRGARLNHGGWDIEILHPPKGWDAARSDDQSLVLRFTAGFRSVLIMGGAGRHVEQVMLNSSQTFSAKILCAGNPARDSLIHQRFMEKVHPERVVFSGEGFNGISPERRDAEQRLGAAGVKTLRPESEETRVISF